eukprot:350318-Chlamydomonas_euryale.AAC.5
MKVERLWLGCVVKEEAWAGGDAWDDGWAPLLWHERSATVQPPRVGTQLPRLSWHAALALDFSSLVCCTCGGGMMRHTCAVASLVGCAARRPALEQAARPQEGDAVRGAEERPAAGGTPAGRRPAGMGGRVHKPPARVYGADAHARIRRCMFERAHTHAHTNVHVHMCRAHVPSMCLSEGQPADSPVAAQGTGSTDAMFILRSSVSTEARHQLPTAPNEVTATLAIAFLDFNKAYDSISRERCGRYSSCMECVRT